MKPVYLPGRGLACALGLDLKTSLAALRKGESTSATRSLRGEPGESCLYPYRAISDVHPDWSERARALVQRVAAEAGAQKACDGALFIATSSFNIGALEQGKEQIDYRAFADDIAAWLEWTGLVYVVSTACTSSQNALLAAHALLRSGEADDALVLGVELDNQMTPGGFAALQLLSPSRSQPFGAQRDGLVLGEAVAALRLSTREPAHWKMLGGASVVDGRQPTGASASAVVSLYQRALTQSGLAANAIDLIAVQAAGSPLNDAVEAQGLLEAFEVMPALVSLKAAIGHTLGAAGAAEIALLLGCLEGGVVPPCPDAVDETLGVKLLARLPDSVRRVMATTLGFGGSHASVVLACA